VTVGVDPTPCRALLEGIRARDGDRIAACFGPGAVLRALTPHQLREEHGPEAIADRYRYWLEPLAGFEVVEADATPIADRVRVRYWFRGRDPEKGPQENEHTAYATVESGRISALNLSCAGFRPAGPPDGSAA